MHELVGPSRERYAATVRMLIMSELREFIISSKTGLPLTLLQIANLLGRSDHKTAHHAIVTGREALEVTARAMHADRIRERAAIAVRRKSSPRMQGGLILAAGCGRALSTI